MVLPKFFETKEGILPRFCFYGKKVVGWVSVVVSIALLPFHTNFKACLQYSWLIHNFEDHRRIANFYLFRPWCSLNQRCMEQSWGAVVCARLDQPLSVKFFAVPNPSLYGEDGSRAFLVG